jgi:hypothetical protein
LGQQIRLHNRKYNVFYSSLTSVEKESLHFDGGYGGEEEGDIWKERSIPSVLKKQATIGRNHQYNRYFMTEVPQPDEDNPEAQTENLHHSLPTRNLRGQTTRDYLLLDNRVSREEGSWRV